MTSFVLFILFCTTIFLIIVFVGLYCDTPMGHHEIDCDIDPNERDKKRKMEKFIYVVFMKDDFTPRTPYKVYLVNKVFTTLDTARNYIKGQNKREHIIIPLDEDGDESWCGFDIKKMKVED